MFTTRRIAAALFCVICLLLSLQLCWGFSLDKEINVGREGAEDVEEHMQLSQHDVWQRQAFEIGKRFMPYVERRELPYQFRIVDAGSDINAFALPGGYVYFTERMWKIMTPDERAGIMAHEITHCDKRHGIDQMIKSQQRTLWTLPLIFLSGGWAQAAIWGNYVVTQRYSREMEREADESGIRLMYKAGYDPAGMVRAMKKLLAISSSYNRYEISEVFASHPDTKKRVAYLTQAAIDLGVDPEDLELRAVDDPARLGNITSRSLDMNLLFARTDQPLAYRQRVLIKKMLWNDDAEALVPTAVATATVLSPGTFPALLIEDEETYGLGAAAEGDGVFPISDLGVIPN